jgi:Flp pilus assembly protein CpaB
LSNTIKVIISVLLAVVTAVLIFFWLGSVRSNQTSFAVYRTLTDVVADETVFSPETVEIVRLPAEFAGGLAGVAVDGSEAAMMALRGRPFTRNLSAGSLVLLEHLETNPAGELSSRLTAGMRALTIPVNASTTVGYFVEPGSLVDVLGTVVRSSADAPAGETAEARISTLTLLQAVRVLAVGRASDPVAYQQLADNGYATVTIEVTPEEAERLVFAMQQVQGGLILLLRHPDDVATVETPSVSWSSWLDGAAQPGAQP